MRIYVSGSLALDRIMSFPGKFSDHILPDKVHILNVCFLVNGLEEKFGGTAGNIAYTLALLQEKPLILSAAGKDFGVYADRIGALGLSLDGIRCMEDEFTASAYITTDQSDNQITAFSPGAMNHQSGHAFDGVDPKDALAIVSPGNLKDMMEYPRIYRERGIPYIFDPGQNIPAFSGDQLLDMLKGSALLICNDYELELVMKATGLDRDGLITRTKAVITTLGEKGALVVGPVRKTEIPAVKVDKVLDPTGAGDAFRSGVLKGLALGRDLVQAALMGAVAAGFCVERHGTQEHFFTLEEFWTRYEENFGSMV